MSNDSLIFYHVSDDYIKFISEDEPKVLFNKSENNTRPYVGFVLKINNLDYLVPLSSKLKKSNKVTTPILNRYTVAQKLADPAIPEKIAIIKYNTMIPIYDGVIKKINLDNYSFSQKDMEYKDLLMKEILFCSENRDMIIKKANNVYDLYQEKPHYLKEIIDSCCDFKLLEQKCLEYIALQEQKEILEEVAESLNSSKAFDN